MLKNLFPFYLVFIFIFIVSIIPGLIQQGMFFDGMVYASIAKNLAEGNGSFWIPYFTKDLWNPFFEHPPLIFGIQSIFFRMFGDHFLVERFYSLLTGIITAILIGLIWKETFRHDPSKFYYSFIPLIFWITTEHVFMNIKNNMLENTMGVLALSSVYFSSKFIFGQRNYLNLIISGLFIFLAFLANGLVSFFAFGTFFLYWLTERKITFVDVIKYSSVLFFTFAASLGGIFILFPEAYRSLYNYFDSSLIATLAQKRQRTYVDSRFKIIWRLGNQILPTLIIVAITLLINNFKGISKIDLPYKKLSLYYLLIGVSASFPIAISPYQSTHYVMPSVPYYAIGFAILILPVIQNIVEKINFKSASFKFFYGFVVVLCISGLLFSFTYYGRIKKGHEGIFHDVHLISEYLPDNHQMMIGIDSTLIPTQSIYSYFKRYTSYEVGDYKQYEHKFLLSRKPNFPYSEYKKISLPTKEIFLYSR